MDSTEAASRSNKVVDAREYQDSKETAGLAEAEAREKRKVEGAAKPLSNKQLKEENESRRAAAQLAKDL